MHAKRLQLTLILTAAWLVGSTNAGEIRPLSIPLGERRVPARLLVGAKDAPLVVVAHGNPGFDQDLLDWCERLASDKLNVLIVDWTTQGPAPPTHATGFPDWRRSTLGNETFWRRGAEDIVAAVDYARQNHLVSVDRVAGLGICGGGVVIAHVAASAPAFRALVFLHAPPRLETERDAKTPVADILDLAGKIRVPLQAHSGLLDKVAKPDDVRALERTLPKEGGPNEFYYYADAGHGFVLSGTPFNSASAFGYVPAASAQVLPRIHSFLEKTLSSSR